MIMTTSVLGEGFFSRRGICLRQQQLPCHGPCHFPGACDSPFTQYRPEKNHADDEFRNEYRCVATVFTNDGQISALAATNEAVYSGSTTTKIRIWKLPEFSECGHFNSGKGSVKSVIVDGNIIYSANQDQKIRVWRRRRVSNGHPSRLKLVATLPTTKDRLANSIFPRSYVQVRRHRKRLWINHLDAVSCLAISQEHDLLYSASWDKTVKVWRLSDFKCLESICAHHDAVNAIVTGPEGLLFTGSSDGSTKIWEKIQGIQTSKHVQIAVLQEPKNISVNALALSSNGAILYAAFSNGSMGYWKIGDSSDCGGCWQSSMIRGHSRSVLCVATTRPDVVVSGSADRTFKVWRHRKYDVPSCIAVLQGHDNPVKCIALSLEKKYGSLVVYSGSLNGAIKKWWVSIHEERDANISTQNKMAQEET